MTLHDRVRRRRWIAASMVVLAGWPAAVAPVDGRQSLTRHPQVTSERGMVASAHPLASQAGIEMLRAGGNAVDAAVAAAFAIGVVEPFATGLGGEGMMVISLAETKTEIAIDYRSTAPAVASFPKGFPATGHAAVAVPGTVAGLALALRKHGTFPLERVVAPAVRYAEEGFTVSSTLAGILVDSFEGLARNEALMAVVCPDGFPIEAGGVLKNPDLAATLRAIGKGGPDVFYRGTVADRIAAEMAAHGGFVTKADLEAYTAIERTPVRGRYRGVDVVSAPPPVAGLSLVQILQILEHFDLPKEMPLSPRYVHLVAEAMKRGFADYNAFVGDPDFAAVPIEGLLAPAYARSRAAEIDPMKVSHTVTAGTPGRDPAAPVRLEAVVEPPSTTSLSVVDARGNMVALTQTISDFFGAKVLVAGTGVILNNEMKNFSARGPNAMAPGKRMRTAIAPTILLRDGRAFATIGTPGGARIISTMVLLVSNLVDFGMGIQEAIEAPRFYARDTERELSVESRLPTATTEALTKMGYAVKPLGAFDLFFGGAQGIVIDPKTGRRIGGADPRRDGAVVGY